MQILVAGHKWHPRHKGYRDFVKDVLQTLHRLKVLLGVRVFAELGGTKNIAKTLRKAHLAIDLLIDAIKRERNLAIGLGCRLALALSS